MVVLEGMFFLVTPWRLFKAVLKVISALLIRFNREFLTRVNRRLRFEPNNLKPSNIRGGMLVYN